jgi:antirestriction protein ArdC
MDYIQVPCKEQFNDIMEFYSTLFHEMVHSTGHRDRLGRLDVGVKLASFGSEEYSKEELIAEIGSAFLMNHIGIETIKTFKNSAAYIQSWLKVLRDDKRFIVSASSKAEKAMKYILGTMEENVATV